MDNIMIDDQETAEVRRFWSDLRLPGIIDIHTHFMPKSVMDKVWNYFDAAGPMVGRAWPITYRLDESTRVSMLRAFGVRHFSALIYPHKPDMAAWLNQWAVQFASQTPECLSTATFYPEPGAPEYVDLAIANGARIFKAHIQVGDYDPNDPLLDDVWAKIEDCSIPVIIHCGSGPQPGSFTGPEPIRRLLRRYPRLKLVIAHMGMPEYSEFLDICLDSDAVCLDTTMAFTAFAEQAMPFPPSDTARLLAAKDRILFGSDYPNIPYGYRDALGALTTIGDIDDDWLRRVLHDNAARLFNLGLPSG